MIKDLFKKKPSTPPKLTAKNLEFAFKDVDDVNYYRINTQMGIGLEHFGKAMEFTMWMAAGLTPGELHSLLDLQEEVIQKIMEGKKGNLATLGWVNREIRMRSQMVIHTELLYNFIACHYIREDESVNEWVESIHLEKVEAFKKCVKERTAYEFFQLPELRNTSEISNSSPEQWTEYWNASIREQQNLTKKVEYLRSALKSATAQKTSRKV